MIEYDFMNVLNTPQRWLAYRRKGPGTREREEESASPVFPMSPALSTVLSHMTDIGVKTTWTFQPQ